MNRLAKIVAMWAIPTAMLLFSLWFHILGKSGWIAAGWFAMTSLSLAVLGAAGIGAALLVTLFVIMSDPDEEDGNGTRQTSDSRNTTRDPPPPIRNM